MKKKAIYNGYNKHDCETKYICPVCDESFGTWDIFRQKENENGTNKYCPYCKEELDGLGVIKE